MQGGHVIRTLVLRALATVLLLCMVSPVPRAENLKEISDFLASELKGQVLTLRRPASDDVLKFDFEGKPLGPHTAGSWVGYSGVLLFSVKVDPDGVKISGNRVMIYFSASREPQVTSTRTQVQIEIQAGENPTDQSVKQAIVNVFATTKDTPGYVPPSTSARREATQGAPSVQIGRLHRTDPVYRVGDDGISPPKITKWIHDRREKMALRV